jgi:hypothetical protein
MIKVNQIWLLDFLSPSQPALAVASGRGADCKVVGLQELANLTFS